MASIVAELLLTERCWYLSIRSSRVSRGPTSTPCTCKGRTSRLYWKKLSESPRPRTILLLETISESCRHSQRRLNSVLRFYVFLVESPSIKTAQAVPPGAALQPRYSYDERCICSQYANSWVDMRPVVAPNNDPQTGVPANPCASAGGAPNPSAYAAAGTIAQVSEFLSPGGLLVNAAYLSGFRRGGALDAQPLGASRAYGNYVFGAYLSAAGIPLSVGLGGANGYAAVSNAQYPGFSMDPNYPAVPQANVANIINGYNAQHNGTLCHK